MNDTAKIALLINTLRYIIEAVERSREFAEPEPWMREIIMYADRAIKTVTRTGESDGKINSD